MTIKAKLGLLAAGVVGLLAIMIGLVFFQSVFVNRKCPRCDPRKGPHPSPPCLMDAA